MDIINDAPRAVLLQISKKCDMPEYIKKAEVVYTRDQADSIPTELFADTVNRAYPISSKADTWLSAAYFAKSASEHKPDDAARISGRIKAAAEVYGISDDVNTVISEITSEPSEKRAEDDDLNYGYPEKRMYPMFDAEGVKLAGVYFDENRDNYPFDMRRTIARNIMRKAAEYAVDVPDSVRREACIGMPRVDFMSIQLIDRASRAPNEKLAEVMRTLNNGLMAATMTDLMSVLEKTAETVSEFDSITGLDMQYGRKVLAPADFLFDISPKEAEEYVEDAVQLGRHIFSLKKLAELPEDVYSDALGDDFVERVKSASGGYDTSKLADELNSLPLPDKNALVDSIRLH